MGPHSTRALPLPQGTRDDRDRGADDRPHHHQHDPLPRRRHGGEGQVGPPRRAARHGADGVGAVEPLPALRPRRSRVAGPRPLRALRRARLGAALRPAPPRRLRPADRGAAPLPPARLEDPGPPRARPRPRRRDDHRSARPGARQLRRHGDRAAGARGALRRRALRLPRVGDRERRRHDGRGRLRGVVARRPPAPGQPQRPLRRQPDLHRRLDRPRLLRGRGGALRRLRLARADGGGRQRPRRAWRWRWRRRPPSARGRR